MSPPTDNPLSRPDLFRRITHEPSHYLTKVLIEENEAAGITWETPEYADIEKTAPKFSLMTKDEVDALLTGKGVARFVTQATSFDHFEAVRLFEAGKPWPLCYIKDGEIWTAGPFDSQQVAFLRQLFQPIKQLELVLYDLSHNYWCADNQPKEGPVHQTRAYWEHVAGEVGADVETVKGVAIALHVYHCCPQSFTKQWQSDRRP
jgi:hypothetical protein